MALNKKYSERLTERAKLARLRLLAGLTAAGLGMTLLTLASGHITARAALTEAPRVSACALTVDGERAVVVRTREQAEGIIDAILGRAATPLTDTASFSRTVAVEECEVPEDQITGAAAALNMLDPADGPMPFGLSVVTQETVVETETIPYATVVEPVEDGYSDEEELVTAGRDGERINTYIVTCRDGVPVLRTLRETAVRIAPVDEVIRRGVLPGSRTDSRGFYIWPTTGIVTSGFGGRDVSVGSKNHKGIDIGNADGTDVLAADGGTVIYTKYDTSGYGNLIKIQHDDGAVTYYAHLKEILVSDGDKVEQGQHIGEMGRTGVATGSHLHFEIRPDGTTPVNPVSHLTGELQRS